MSGDEITLQVGKLHQCISHLPPIGTQIIVHKHLTEDGAGVTVEVIGHEWHLMDADADGKVFMRISAKTKTVAGG